MQRSDVLVPLRNVSAVVTARVNRGAFKDGDWGYGIWAEDLRALVREELF